MLVETNIHGRKYRDRPERFGPLRRQVGVDGIDERGEADCRSAVDLPRNGVVVVPVPDHLIAV